jgi:anti-sigma factor (TIGR02949 family)
MNIPDEGCLRVMEFITAAIDGELTNADRIALDRHLSACSRCQAEYTLERLTKVAVKTNCRRVSVPDVLWFRIHTELVAHDVESAQSSMRSSLVKRFLGIIRKDPAPPIDVH